MQAQNPDSHLFSLISETGNMLSWILLILAGGIAYGRIYNSLEVMKGATEKLQHEVEKVRENVQHLREEVHFLRGLVKSIISGKPAFGIRDEAED